MPATTDPLHHSHAGGTGRCLEVKEAEEFVLVQLGTINVFGSGVTSAQEKNSTCQLGGVLPSSAV